MPAPVLRPAKPDRRDAQGRRKSKTVGSTTTDYVTDADNREVLEYDGASGALERWYAFGQGPDAVLGQMNVAAATRETMIPDIQGSIIGALDSGTGVLTKSGYQPFGENPSVITGTYRYTGRRFDGETAGSAAQPSGLYYYRARMNSPTWGRFLQPDPIGYAGGENLYAYVGNDPLNLTDPSGRCGPLTANCIGSVIGGIAGGIGGGLAGYHATGTLSGTLIGAGTGTAAGAAIGFVSPIAVEAAAAAGSAAGGSVGAGIAAGTTVLGIGAGSGAAGAAAADVAASQFANGSVNLGYDVAVGAIVGAGVVVPEATATGLAAGFGVSLGVTGGAAISTNSALLGTVGAIGTTCTVSAGCGPSGTPSISGLPSPGGILLNSQPTGDGK